MRPPAPTPPPTKEESSSRSASSSDRSPPRSATSRTRSWEAEHLAFRIVSLYQAVAVEEALSLGSKMISFSS